MRNFLFIFLFCLCALFEAQNITAKIIGVKDGDTVVILYDGKPVTIRLAHIDCPEKKQPFGMKAKLFASEFCFGKTVQIVGNGKKDRNGRWIAEVYWNNQNLGKELTRNGLAWHYKRYSSNAAYSDLEKEARRRKRGMWADPNAVAPWEWRKTKPVYPHKAA